MRRVEAGKAAIAAAAILSTIPAVGGYSNTVPNVGGDFTTVGIVTQVEGGAFAVHQGKSAANTVAIGQGILSGDRVWVEPKGLVRIADTDGGRVTVSGPSTIEFLRRGRHAVIVRVHSGSVVLRAADGEVLRFEHPLVAGSIAGEGALWSSRDLVQLVGLAGDVKAWHPHLEQAAALVAPGFFVESSTHFKHLQPSKPTRVDAKRVEVFLSRFEEKDLAPVSLSRGVASEGSAEDGSSRGTRSAAELAEEKMPQVDGWLKAHISGKNIEEEPQDEAAPLSKRGPKFDAYSKRRKH